MNEKYRIHLFALGACKHYSQKNTILTILEMMTTLKR